MNKIICSYQIDSRKNKKVRVKKIYWVLFYLSYHSISIVDDAENKYRLPDINRQV